MQSNDMLALTLNLFKLFALCLKRHIFKEQRSFVYNNPLKINPTFMLARNKLFVSLLLSLVGMASPKFWKLQWETVAAIHMYTYVRQRAR